LHPDFAHQTLIIDNFWNLNCEVVYSSELSSNGVIWRLKVYPRGNGVAKDQYLSVFLEQVQGVKEGSRYEYKIHMINFADSYQTLIREFVSEFNTEECWGYNRFYKLDNL
jgi:hypothetical protein